MLDDFDLLCIGQETISRDIHWKEIMRNLLTIISAAMILCSCGNERRMLVLYYSQTGNTKAVAEEIQSQTGAHIEAISIEEPYDGTFEQTIARCLEERDKGILPTMRKLKHNPSRYDVVFIGYPVWFGTYAPPIASLARRYNFDEKTVVPFCTFGSGGLNTSAADLEKALPNSRVERGYGVRAARLSEMKEEVSRFLIENGYIEGTVEPLGEYSQQEPVTDEEASIFAAACSSYQFDLGTPVSTGIRRTGDSIDYRFVARVIGKDGTPALTTVYVTVRNGQTPVFTEVVR